MAIFMVGLVAFNQYLYFLYVVSTLLWLWMVSIILGCVYICIVARWHVWWSVCLILIDLSDSREPLPLKHVFTGWSTKPDQFWDWEILCWPKKNSRKWRRRNWLVGRRVAEWQSQTPDTASAVWHLLLLLMMDWSMRRILSTVLMFCSAVDLEDDLDLFYPGSSQKLTSRDLTQFAHHVARGMEYLSSKKVTFNSDGSPTSELLISKSAGDPPRSRCKERACHWPECLQGQIVDTIIIHHVHCTSCTLYRVVF